MLLRIDQLLFNNGLNITAHTVAMWLTVSLAVFRYFAVCHPTVGSRVCTLRRARIAVGAVVVSTIVFCSPNYFMFRVATLSDGSYWFDRNPFITDRVENLNFWIFGVVLKVCALQLFGYLWYSDKNFPIRGTTTGEQSRKKQK